MPQSSRTPTWRASPFACQSFRSSSRIGTLRGDGDAMVHRLAADDDVVVAEPPEQPFRELAVADLGLLQAEDVGRFLDEEFLDDLDAGADRIDVPGRDFQSGGHGGGLSGRWPVDVGGENGRAPAPGAWSGGPPSVATRGQLRGPVRATGGKPETGTGNCSSSFRPARPVAQMNERSAARAGRFGPGTFLPNGAGSNIAPLRASL